MTLPDNKLAAEELRRLSRAIVKADEPMSKHTTFGIGGPADIYVEPADADDLATIISWAKKADVPTFVFGDGANLLVSDKGIRGIAVRMGKPFMNVKIDGEKVLVGSGAKLDKVVNATVNESLGGLENTAGIPGTVGGAIVMNAGTYRGQIGDVIELVSVVTCDGERRDMSAAECEFRYRWSVFQADKSKIIVGAVLGLKAGDRAELVRTAQHIRRRRNLNLPEGRSAGCVFKNPDGQSAGQLIDAAGLKGTCIGDATVADKHGNFILNRGTASAEEVRALAEKVRSTVKASSGFDLEYEVRLVGEW